MDYQRKHDWRAVIRGIDPGAESRISDFINYTIARETSTPRKLKELILMASSAAMRYGVSTRVHGLQAMKHGATRAEVLEVLSIVSIQAGFTAFVDAVEALGDELIAATETDAKPPSN